MLIEATDVRQVRVSEITDDDARRGGRDPIAPRSCRRLGTADPVWRVDFVFVGPDDRIARRNDTSPEDLTDVMARLVALDRQGAWTRTDPAADRAVSGNRLDDVGSPRQPGTTCVQAQRAQVERARADREPRGRLPPVATRRGRAARHGLTEPVYLCTTVKALVNTRRGFGRGAENRSASPCGSSIGRTVVRRGSTTRARRRTAVGHGCSPRRRTTAASASRCRATRSSAGTSGRCSTAAGSATSRSRS